MKKIVLILLSLCLVQSLMAIDQTAAQPKVEQQQPKKTFWTKTKIALATAVAITTAAVVGFLSFKYLPIKNKEKDTSSDTEKVVKNLSPETIQELRDWMHDLNTAPTSKKFLSYPVITQRNIDTRGENDNTPLMVAAINGDLDLFEELLKDGANPNAQNKEHATPLMLIAKYVLNPHEISSAFRFSPPHRKHAFETLMKHNPDITKLDNSGKTALMYLIDDPNFEGIAFDNYFLSKLATKETVNLQDKEGETALFKAAKNHQKIRVLMLIDAFGADPNIRDIKGRSPLDIARATHPSKWHLSVVSLLESPDQEIPKHKKLYPLLYEIDYFKHRSK